MADYGIKQSKGSENLRSYDVSRTFSKVVVANDQPDFEPTVNRILDSYEYRIYKKSPVVVQGEGGKEIKVVVNRLDAEHLASDMIPHSIPDSKLTDFQRKNGFNMTRAAINSRAAGNIIGAFSKSQYKESTEARTHDKLGNSKQHGKANRQFVRFHYYEGEFRVNKEGATRKIRYVVGEEPNGSYHLYSVQRMRN